MKLTVFDWIKKQNGEQFAKVIRKYDSGIFEIKDIEKIVAFAGRDASSLLFFLESLKINQMLPSVQTDLSLSEILSQAGYDFLIADDLEKQQSMRSFFAPGEELCTFKDLKRFQNYHILYLIKKGAGDLKRKDFKNPKREDEYATSLMSIQILKTGGFIKITNRYNHSVEGADNTFFSNPDYIAMGLSSALKKHFDVDFQSGTVDLPNGFLFLNNRLYKYHLEMQNVYYGADFYLKDGVRHSIEKDYQLLVDNFILDFKENKIIVPHQEDEDIYPEDAFLSLLKRELKDKKLSLKKENKDTYIVEADGRCVLKARYGCLIYANLKMPIEIESPVFVHHNFVEEVYFDNVTSFAPYSFSSCPKLRVLGLKNALFVPSNSIRNMPCLEELDLSAVQKVGQSAIVSLPALHTLMMKNVREIQSYSLMLCDKISEFIFYKLEKIGSQVMSKNKNLKRIMAPLLKKTGFASVSENLSLTDVCFLSLKKVGSNSLCSNNALKLLVLNQVESISKGAISSNKNLKVVLMNGVKSIGLNAFFMNTNLKWVEFEALQEVTHCNCFYKMDKNCCFYVPNLSKDRYVLEAIVGKKAFTHVRKIHQKER